MARLTTRRIRGKQRLVKVTRKRGRERVRVVDRPNLGKYAGTWYEQGSTPAWFSRGCKATKAEYDVNRDGTVSVKNSCKVDGGSKTAYGTAYSTNDPKTLKVGFFPSKNPIITGPYKISRLESRNGRYSSAIVKSGNKSWILTRRKRISKREYVRLRKLARDRSIQRTVQ